MRATWEMLLPTGTRLVGGEPGLDRSVSWPVVMRTTPPAFESLSGNELAIVPLDRLTLLDANLTLAGVIAQLARTRIAAICAIGEVDPPAMHAADRAGLPLLQLPAGSNALDVQSSVARSLAEHRSLLSSWVQQAGRELSDLAIEGRDRAAIVRRAGQLAGTVSGLRHESGQVECVYAPLDAPLSRAVVEEMIASARLDEGSAVVGERPGLSMPTIRIELGDHLTALVAPLRGRARNPGHVFLIAYGREISGADAALLEQAALACSIDVVREEASTSAREALFADFLDEVLTGTERSDDELIRRGGYLGHDLLRPYIALAIRVETSECAEDAPMNGAKDATTEAIGAAVASARAGISGVLITGGRDSYLALVPAGGTNGDAATADAEGRLRERFRRHGLDAVSVGIGGVGAGPRQIRLAAERARQALLIGRQFMGPGRSIAFDDLGVRRLLFELRGPVLERFHEQTLGRLIERDRRGGGGELVRTLDAYLSAGCSPSLAAERLHLHRNGMNYRLQRIRELLALDLDDPEQRLALHLALRIGEILHLDDTVRSAQSSSSGTGARAQ